MKEEILQGNIKNCIEKLIGEYVIVRTLNEGVNAGYLVAADDTGCVVREARRLHYHGPKDKRLAWYEGVSQSGLADNCVVSCKTLKIIVEDYSLTVCTDQARKSIEEFKTHESSD